MREIKIAESDGEIQSCYAVMAELRPHIPPEEFLERIKRQNKNSGYRLVYLSDGEVKAVGGFRIAEWLSGGKYLEIEDLVAKDGERSKGFGGELFDWIVDFAGRENCSQIKLVSHVRRFGAHRFYLNKKNEYRSALFFAEVVMKGISIRTAIPADAPEIAAVLAKAFAEYESLYTTRAFAATTPNSEVIKSRLTEGETWVALLDDKIVGAVSVVPEGDSLYIRSMAVLPEARGAGIGERLLTEIEHYAIAGGFRRLFLSTTPFLHRAIRLYEKFGFERSDQPPHELYGTPLLTMSKDLSNASEIMIKELIQTERTKLRRLPKRGSCSREIIDKILDEAFVCHIGFTVDGQPFVIPTAYARAGDNLLIHGSQVSRMMRALAGGVEVCVTITLVDGLVLARSAFHHSINYRSVVIFGKAHVVRDKEEKLAALRAFTEHIVPDRWPDVRPPTEDELKATTVLSLPLQEASAKVRTGDPIDDEEDYAMNVWAGVIPLQLLAGPPAGDAKLKDGIGVPGYVAEYRRVSKQG